MAFRQYTQCYNHTPGDKPFNESDLASFALGTSAPGIIAAILGFLSGNPLAAFVAIGVQYAVTITAIANEWLTHRLVCVSGDQCAVGTVDLIPTISTILGAFDNDQFFDVRLMPHRYLDLYRGPNCNYATLGSASGWVLQTPPQAGPSLDGKTETIPENDVFLDGFQGSALLQPGSPAGFTRAGAVLSDLPYTPVDISEVTLVNPPLSTELPRFNATCSTSGSTPVSGTPLFTRATLHCEAEGNFWAALKSLPGRLAGPGRGWWRGGGSYAAGAAAGCAIGGFFHGPIGCALGALIGSYVRGCLAAPPPGLPALRGSERLVRIPTPAM